MYLILALSWTSHLIACDDPQPANPSSEAEPQNIPRFCLNGLNSSPVACAFESVCLEYLPGDVSVEEVRAECVNDGGQALQNCAVTQRKIIGACNEGERLRVFFEGVDEGAESSFCVEDGFSWVTCDPT